MLLSIYALFDSNLVSATKIISSCALQLREYKGHEKRDRLQVLKVCFIFSDFPAEQKLKLLIQFLQIEIFLLSKNFHLLRVINVVNTFYIGVPDCFVVFRTNCSPSNYIFR